MASWQSYLKYAKTASVGYGNSINFYKIMIVITVVGYVANGEVQPGNTYSWIVTNITPANHPTYATIVSQTYDPDADNDTDGTAYNDDKRGGFGNDTLRGDGANDTLEGGAGDDTLYRRDGKDFFVINDCAA